MFHQSMSRRAKGSKAKNILQVMVLLAVVVWLLYQTKHSYDRKTEYAEAKYSKLSKGDTNIQFGRKINPGSENVITVDPHGKNSDEITDTGETGVDQDAFGGNFEGNAEEVRHEREESSENITDSGKEETQQESQDNVDDNGNPQNAGEIDTEGMQESLRLPSERDGGNYDEKENQNEDANSSEDNRSLKGDATTADVSNVTDEEKVTSDEEMLSATNQTENVENAGQQGETGEARSEHSNRAVPVTQEPTNSSVYNDQSNQDQSADKDSHGGETVEAQEGSGSDVEVTTNNRGEEATRNVESGTESQLGSSSHAQIDDDSSVELGGTDRSSEDGNNNFPKSVDENNFVMPDSNGAPGREERESQIDRTVEGQVIGNYSIETVTSDVSSEGDNVNLANASEENGTVMPDNNGVPKEEEVQPQMDHVSEGEKADNDSSEETRTDKNNSKALMEELNASDAEATTAVTIEKENDPKPQDKASNPSLYSKNKEAELLGNREDTTEWGVQSQASANSNAENISGTSVEEENEKSNELAAESAQTNEKNNSDLPTSKTFNEEVASDEDNALKVGTAGKNVEDAMAEPVSEDVTASDPGNNIRNRTAEVQESSTDSESSTSEEHPKTSTEL